MENITAWYKKPEMIVAMSALLISVVTAVVGIYSAYVDRSYARASIWPRLEVFRSYGANKFDYGVTNSGNGPALIKYAVIKYNDKPIQYWRDIPKLEGFTQSHIGRRILSPQRNVMPLYYRGKDADTYLTADKLIDIELCYCSIYEECWLVDRLNEAKEVKSCEAKGQTVFLQ